MPRAATRVAKTGYDCDYTCFFNGNKGRLTLNQAKTPKFGIRTKFGRLDISANYQDIFWMIYIIINVIVFLLQLNVVIIVKQSLYVQYELKCQNLIEYVVS